MFRAEQRGMPRRAHVSLDSGDLLMMPAEDAGGAGVKLVTVTPANPARGLPLIHGLYVLFAPDTLAPIAILDGAALTALRTAAVSGLATRYLAQPDARHLAIVGAGTQARAHLDAMRAVRPIERVRIVSRSREKADQLAEQARDAGLDATLAGPEAMWHTGILCTCTTSPTPVVDGTALAPGTHINAIGAYRPETRELDDATMQRGRLVVELRDAALAEAGDLIIPLQSGVIAPSDIIADLFEVARGSVVRRSAEDITVFKSVGMALEDLAVASAAMAALQGCITVERRV